MRIRLYRWRQISLVTRVTTFVGVTFITCIVTLGLIVQKATSSHFAYQDADELRVVAAAVLQAMQGDVDQIPGSSLRLRLSNAVSGHHGVYYGLFDGEGNNLYSTPGPDLSHLTQFLAPVDRINIDNMHQWSEGPKNYRGTVVGLKNGASGTFDGHRIVVASSTDFHLEFLDDFRIKLWAILVCTSLLILFSAWLAAVIAHRPLHRMGQEIDNITTEKLNIRLDPDDVPVDLLELVNSFNKMISPIEEVFQRLSNFSADIAHELRTPITNLSTQTQVSLNKVREAEEYREILYSNLEEYERIAKMINDMLWLAQSDNGMLKPRFAPLDPMAEVYELFDYLGAWAEERQVSLSLVGNCPMINGDRAMLRRALTNLLSNAIHHTAAGNSICVRLGTDDNSVKIDVENQGDEIPADNLPYIFERFYRIDPSRQSNNSGTRTGLGLSIVRSIFDIHKGTITVTSENRLTSFHITLPILVPA